MQIILYILYAVLAVLVVRKAFSKKFERLHDFDKRASLSLKGILAVCVVVRHLLGQSYMVSGMIPLGYYAVILFFFCAGYGLMFQLKLQGERYLNNFFSMRWLKVFIPFGLATLIYIVINEWAFSEIGGG